MRVPIVRRGAMAAIAAIAFFVFDGAYGYAQNTPAAAQGAASVSGTVQDTSGAPVSGASVVLRGSSSYSASTDSKGAFTFASVTPGLYTLSVSRSGYSSALESDIVALAGQTQSITVRLSPASFSSLQTIATVRATGRASMNTSAASVNVVSSQAFADQAQPQVTRVLSQVPGLQISFPSNSSNAASPGSITIPNIRGATSYETASLVDGHPISVGQYGDNVTTFLNTFMFSNVEVIKGPGANAPVVNNAIGGTTNFRTKNPTLTPVAEVAVGVDNHGGTLSNLGFSNTVGKLGFVVDLATNNTTSALNGNNVYFDPSAGNLNGGTLQGNAGSTQLFPTQSFATTQYPLLACCYAISGSLDQVAELLKARYQFSPVTQATVSYLAGVSQADQNGNTSDFTNGQFVPGDPAYSGALKPGPVQVASIFAGALNGETNIEPIFQAEASTALGKNTILARFYNASILRYQFQGTNLNSLDYNFVRLYGVSSGSGNLSATFNGTPSAVGFSDYYEEPESDKLSGGSFEFQHPIGENLLSFSVDRTVARSVDYSVFPGPFYSFNLPPGTWQMLTTYNLRGHFYLTPRLEMTLSDYENTYYSAYPIGCPAGGCNTQAAAVNGTGVQFGSTRNTHNDPRVAFVFRPNPRASMRFAIGSSIAPPFLGLLSQITSTPTYDSTNHVAIEQQSNGNLKPETGFGFDLGADVRLFDADTVFSGDVYQTNLFDRFFAQTIDTGEVCGTTFVCSGGAPAGTPILNQTNGNISNARFQGIELTLKREPLFGFGFNLSGALQRGYYYDLPPGFYCSIPSPNCTPDQNLNVISGENVNGVGIGVGGLSYNGNMRIPYAQGNAEFSYTLRNGAYASIGETYYGHNNSLNEPAFGIAYATLRYPVAPHLTLQLSGDNMFNAYPGILPIYGGGVPIPLYGGGSAATVGNVLGPATYRLILSTKLP